MFETVVRRCIAEGLVGGEGFAVDGSLIVADARRQNGVADPSALRPEASRAVAEYLIVFDDAAFGAATTVKPKFTLPVALSAAQLRLLFTAMDWTQIGARVMPTPAQ